jgi:hypothetical protein
MAIGDAVGVADGVATGETLVGTTQWPTGDVAGEIA